MLSFEVRGGKDAAIEIASRLRLVRHATSLGGVETTVDHRASVEGPDSPTPPSLLRMSVGIESCEDMLADLDRALAVTA